MPKRASTTRVEHKTVQTTQVHQQDNAKNTESKTKARLKVETPPERVGSRATKKIHERFRVVLWSMNVSMGDSKTLFFDEIRMSSVFSGHGHLFACVGEMLPRAKQKTFLKSKKSVRARKMGHFIQSLDKEMSAIEIFPRTPARSG